MNTPMNQEKEQQENAQTEQQHELDAEASSIKVEQKEERSFYLWL